LPGARVWDIVSSPPPTLREPLVTTPTDGAPQPELVRLRDGSLVTIRPVREGDQTLLRVFLSGLCAEARRLRFFSGAIDTAKAAQWAAGTDTRRFGLVAHDETGMIVGHAVYIVLVRARAEVAVEVADHLHGRGLGTILIERLALVAEERGITHFVAEVLCENHAMLEVFREGFDARVVRHQGPEERVEFLTSGWRLAHERFEPSAGARGQGVDGQRTGFASQRSPACGSQPKNSCAVS
jgi:GNAT superfamily N-acetyltransferase